MENTLLVLHLKVLQSGDKLTSLWKAMNEITRTHTKPRPGPWDVDLLTKIDHEACQGLYIKAISASVDLLVLTLSTSGCGHVNVSGE